MPKVCPFLDECNKRVPESHYFKICKGKYTKCPEYHRKQYEEYKKLIESRIRYKTPREWKAMEKFS